MYIVNLDPVAFSFMGFDLRWYSISYIVAMLFVFLYYKKFLFFDIKTKMVDNMLFYLPLSIVLGGRIGYILFYDLEHWIYDPMFIFRIWEGGMSFHGGMVFVVIWLIIFSRLYMIPILYTFDISACVAPIGIFFGRLANFVNSELYGHITNVPWSVVFERVDNFPRHPSQIYEAIGEGVILFLITNYLLFYTDSLKRSGRISAIFAIGYSSIRIFLELFRVPDKQIGYLFFGATLGQLLSIPLFLIGILIFFYSFFNVNTKL